MWSLASVLIGKRPKMDTRGTIIAQQHVQEKMPSSKTGKDCKCQSVLLPSVQKDRKETRLEECHSRGLALADELRVAINVACRHRLVIPTILIFKMRDKFWK